MTRNRAEISDRKAVQWTPADSRALYRVDSWGAPYFFVNDAGHVAVRVESEKGTQMQIDVVEVVEELRNRGVQFPMLIRFQDILRGQVRRLNKAFRSAIAELDVGRRAPTAASGPSCGEGRQPGAHAGGE